MRREPFPSCGGDADEVVALVQGNVQMLTEKSNPINSDSLTKEVQLKVASRRL